MGISWREVLLAARKISQTTEDGVFAATDLAEALEIKSTERSTSTAIASAWLSKLSKWGYLLRCGKRKGSSGRGRKQTLYHLTRWGLRFNLSTRASSREEAREEARKVAANPSKDVRRRDDGEGAFTARPR